MSSKKNSIQVKLELKDELKALIEAESTREFRSCTQQVYYILNKYYKEGFGIQNPVIRTNEELLGTNSEYKEPTITNRDFEESKSEQYVTDDSENTTINDEYEAEEYTVIDPDILDF